MQPTLTLAWMISPWFFGAGVLLAAIPIIIHILNRRRFKIIQWAAMEYLLQALRKNRRRLKFEQLLLLITRCALLGLLGLALARPLGCTDSRLAAFAGSRTALHIFIIDNSYSMAYEADRQNAQTHLEQAKILVRQQLDRLAPGNEAVAIIAAARPAQGADGRPRSHVVLRPGYDLDAAKAAVERMEQSYAGTDIPGALNAAMMLANEQNAQPQKFLYILSDNTRSAWENPDHADILKSIGRQLDSTFGKGRIRVHDLSKGGQWNQAVLNVRPDSPLVTAVFHTDFLADVRGYGQPADATVHWKLEDKTVGDSQRVRLDPNTEPVRNAKIPTEQGGAKLINVTLAGDDRLKLDNVRNRVVEVASELKVLIVEGQRGGQALSGSGVFLEMALAPRTDDSGTARRRRDTYVAPELISHLDLGGKVFRDYRAVILADVPSLSPSRVEGGKKEKGQAELMADWVREGGTLMMFMGPQVELKTCNDVLLPLGLLPGELITQMTATDTTKAFTLDFRPNGPLHPILQVFRGEKESGLDKARIFNYIQMDVSNPPVEIRPGGTVEVILPLGADAPVLQDPTQKVIAWEKNEVIQGRDEVSYRARVQTAGEHVVRAAVGSRRVIVKGNPADANAPSLRITLLPQAEPVLKYIVNEKETNDPAITVHRLGKGRVVVVTTTANGDWNSLPPKPAYIPLVHELLAGTVEVGDRWMNLTVGQPLVVPTSLRLGLAPELKDPSGKPVPIDAATSADKQVFYQSAALNRPGVYELNTGGAKYPIVVNVPADEADIRPISADAIRKALGDIELAQYADSMPTGSMGDDISDLGWTVMCILLALACVECVMAMYFGHHSRSSVQQGPAAAPPRAA